jgi:hypothetical protein
MNGRFAKGGGGQEPDPLNEWFLKAPWWKKLLALAAFALFFLWLYANGYVLVFIILAWVLVWIMKLIRAFLEG